MSPDCSAPSRSAVPAASPNHSGHQALTSREKISRKRSIAESESPRGIKRLQRQRRKASSARSDRSRKGWSPERRARQAALIGSWAPWRRSTGPKTDAGKARCAMNALRHGFRSQATIREYQRIRYVLRLAAQNIALLRLHIRLRDARLRIKYKFPPIGERAKAPSRHAWEVRANTSFPSPLVGEGHRPVGSVRFRRTMRVRGRPPIRKPRAPTLLVSAPAPWD